ncbi:unnamed protein product [Owenia fusiformis]|uniref:G-protein coupled receptors family 1 profile domain-containing protein n=1 Tax=Owenia fusiformis TaxID=6347 RepID=A0A8S4N6B2_OWEFU|nr:unnamed protein product [Owenia fusiformis]
MSQKLMEMMYLTLTLIWVGLGTVNTDNNTYNFTEVNFTTEWLDIDALDGVTTAQDRPKDINEESLQNLRSLENKTGELEERTQLTTLHAVITWPSGSPTLNETFTTRSGEDAMPDIGDGVHNSTDRESPENVTMALEDVKLDDTSQDLGGCEIWKYGGFVLVFFGVLFNILSILVFSRKNIRKSTTTVMLTILAFVDSFNLLNSALGMSLRCTIGIPGMFTEYSYWTCKIGVVILFVMTDLSPFLVALLAIERCIAVALPHRASIIISTKRVKIAVLITVVVLLAANLQLAFIIEYNPNSPDQFYCTPSEGYTTYYREIFLWIDLALLSVIPLSIVITCNVIILVNVMYHRRSQKSMVAMYKNNNKNNINSLTFMLVSKLMMMMYLTLTMILLVGLGTVDTIDNNTDNSTELNFPTEWLDIDARDGVTAAQDRPKNINKERTRSHRGVFCIDVEQK